MGKTTIFGWVYVGAPIIRIPDISVCHTGSFGVISHVGPRLGETCELLRVMQAFWSSCYDVDVENSKP